MRPRFSFNLRVVAISIAHINNVVILLTVDAASPIGITTSRPRRLPDMQQRMVSLILANDKIRRRIIALITIYMVDLSTFRKTLSQCFFTDNYMLSNIPILFCCRMIGHPKVNIAVFCDCTQTLTAAMPAFKPTILAYDTPKSGMWACNLIGRFTTTTLAQL